MLLHGLTATRRYVVYGSRALPRNGFETIAYDARGHGESEPPQAGGGYSYAELAADLGAVLDRFAGSRRFVLAGHSMGAHTLAAYALGERPRSRRSSRRAGLGPGPRRPGRWPTGTRLPTARRGGVEGFIAAYDDGLDPAWRETLLRITRERLALHRHPEAVARALREVPRSLPFDGLGSSSTSRPRRWWSAVTTRRTQATRTRSPGRGQSGC